MKTIMEKAQEIFKFQDETNKTFVNVLLENIKNNQDQSKVSEKMDLENLILKANEFQLDAIIGAKNVMHLAFK